MTDEELCGWLRSMQPASGFAPTENWAPWLGADRIEALEAEVERLKDQLSVETEPSPYCPICGSCGDEGRCGSKRCMYPDTGIEALQAENAELRAANQAAAECVAAMMEECARYRDEIYAVLQETVDDAPNLS